MLDDFAEIFCVESLATDICTTVFSGHAEVLFLQALMLVAYRLLLEVRKKWLEMLNSGWLCLEDI